MRAQLARLFQNVDIFGGKRGLRAGFVVAADEPREMQGAGEARGSRAHDEHIRVEPLAFASHAAILARGGGQYGTIRQKYRKSRMGLPVIDGY